jgi:release factor glutamine methyltransferase
MKEIADLVGVPLDQSFYALSEIKLEKIEEDLLSGIPFDYLRGESEFYESKFYVNQDVLIPRPETELLVDMIVSEQKKENLLFADVGTGSGCIGLSLLLKKSSWKGSLIDISPAALEVAKINAKNLRLLKRSDFLLSDRLQKVPATFSYDLIVSNPPYIKESTHRHLVHESVNDYEPHLALYLKDTEYRDWFESFFRDIFSKLSDGGFFYMEGHELELESQKDQLQKIGFKSVEVMQDLTRRDRFLKANK